MINRWYNAGYFTPNFSASTNGLTSSTTEIIGNKAKAPTAMCFPEISSYIDSRVEKARENGYTTYDLMGVPNPRQSKDQTVHLIQTNGKLGMSAAITTKCSDEKAKEIVEWFDYLYSEEGIELMNYGVEGISYTMKDGKREFCQGIKDNPDKGFYEWASYGFPTVADVTRTNMFRSDKALQAVEQWQWKNDGAWNLKTTSTLTSEEANEVNSIMSTALIYIGECLPKFIKGSMDINTEFESYLNTLIDTYKVEDAIKIRSDSYIKWLDRNIPDKWESSVMVSEEA